jgi:hypothetical protein
MAIVEPWFAFFTVALVCVWVWEVESLEVWEGVRLILVNIFREIVKNCDSKGHYFPTFAGFCRVWYCI